MGLDSIFHAELIQQGQTEVILQKNKENNKATNKIQWGSEYKTSLLFKWSKRGWMPNGLVFECRTAQPFEYLTNGHHLVFL